MTRFKAWLATLSFRTGCIVAAVSVICYAISFVQMLLPFSTAVKGIIWVIFFGLAKTAQYTALLIFGKAGLTRLSSFFSREKNRC